MNNNSTYETTDKTLFMDEFVDDSVTMTMDDIEKILIHHSRDNGNVPHTPESTMMTLAGILQKEYAMRRIYSPEAANAHRLGNIHIHNADMPSRLYCGGHSPSYVAKYGLSLPNLNSAAKPAKYADVFLEQLIKFAASMQGHFSGAVGFDAVNMFIAPYLVGLSDEKVKQCAQILVYEFAQQAVARGGQVIFSDLNLYWEIPKHYQNVEAIGPGGVSLGVPYKEFDYESKRFMKALMQVYAEGDGAGRPFFFPKADCHITAESVDNEEYMNMLGSVASKMGSPYFVFDRGNDPSVSQCCRLKLTLSKNDVDELKTPWASRFTALQNVTMNLPAFAYQAGGDENRFNEILYENMMIAKDAHQQKLSFISHLLDLGEEGPLNMLNMSHDGTPYARYDKMKFLIGMVGLNEAVQLICGEELHESKQAYMIGMKIIAQMNANCKDVTRELGFSTILEQTPAESTAYRFARLDMKRYGEPITKIVKGTVDSPYYTNSTYLNVGANIDPIERVKKEGKFHTLIDAGAITHVWLGNKTPDPASIAQFVRKTFYNTSNAQIAFSPEFTTCNTCQRTQKGLSDKCYSCGSENVDGITRVTGYFSRTSNWNKAKKQELRDRARVIV